MTPGALAYSYASEVVSGEIPAGKYAVLACQRFLDDDDRTDWPWRFSHKAANAAVEFQQSLPHTKGQWAQRGEALIYQPWQCFIEANIFGWVHKETGLRRFRESYEEVARKNGKSIRLAARGLYMFAADGEYGAEVYSGAGNERQAWEVFRPAREMVRRTPALKGQFDIEVNAKNLVILSNGSRFEPMIGKPGDGASPSFYICDEFHEHPDPDQYETMVTGMAARQAPLASVITTAGSNLSGPCYEKRQDAISVLEGSVVDDTFFAIIYCADEGDAWDSEEALAKANPNLDVSVSREFLLNQMEKARRSASLQNAFKTKHLCQWVGSSVSWMNMLAWQRQKKDLQLEDYAGKRAWVGVDLASKKDLAAIAVLIPDGHEFATFYDFFCPEDSDNPKYRNLSEYITFTPGSATDYAFIEERLKDICNLLSVQQISFDPWQAQYLMQRMAEGGMPVSEFPHQVRTMSDPMKEVEAMVLDRRLFHCNPVMDWMMGNVVVKSDAKENVYPTKERKNDDKSKIDGVVALIMAMGIYLRAKDDGDLDAWLADPVAI
jgi:phage terminase large subunit-like protein